jgi:hypothetical protein
LDNENKRHRKGQALKKRFPVYTLLFALYPVVMLYARLPGGVPPHTVVRTFLAQALVVLALFAWVYFRTKMAGRAALAVGFAVFYFSSTGYIYRLIPGGSVPAWIHLALVALGVFIVATLNHPHIWKNYLTPVRLNSLTLYLNLVAVLALAYPTYRIASILVEAADDASVSWTEIVRQKTPHQTLTADAPPDIYYIILDGYGRQDALLDVFGYDNSGFIQALRERGFYVADESRSNYIRTVVSLSSSLNMNYINFAEDEAGRRSLNYLPLYDLIQHGQVRALLEEADYTIVAVSADYALSDWKDADTYLYPYSVDLTEFERVYLGTTAIGAFFDTEFAFTDELRSILPLPSYGTRRERINYTFTQLAEIPKIDGPKFVFAHIIAPHPPFVFDREGQPVITNRPYAPGDGEGFSGDKTEYRARYVEQIQYVNTQVLIAVDAILSTSATPPVIILQGDHGSGSLLDPTSLEKSCMFERTSILNAYYLPGGKTDLLYPSITPVNSFRVVFNGYFQTNYPLLSDRTYYSPPVNPYGFVDISDTIETTCSE